jgi:8-oxo-dGTP pyrophosphatase MutT (NUDIX family)
MIALVNPESVAGIVFSPDRTSVLLIQRRDVPVWVLPGGGIDPHESAEEAVVREILEETGFTVKAVRLVGAYTPINRLSKRTHLYECSILKGKPALSEETKNVCFYPLIALPKLIPPPFREWIEDARLQRPPVDKALTSVTYFNLIKNFIYHPLLVIRFLLARLGWAINT